MATFVEIYDAKNRLSELVAEATAGSEVVLTEDSQPRVRLVPVASVPKPRIAGLHAGSIWISDDFDAPLPDDFWTGTP